MSLNETPSGNRLHIALFGKRNSGKSSLINALLGQDVAITSSVAGTTADPVSKAVELHPLGPCILIDTAGFDDEGELGLLRVEKTRKILDETDLAVLVFTDLDIEQELSWAKELKARKIPFVPVINKSDILLDTQMISGKIIDTLHLEPILVSAETYDGIDDLRTALVRSAPENFDAPSLVGHMVSPHDVVLLIMPQDIQAPKGRLILPQVQTIRNLLDELCIVSCTTYDQMDAALNSLAAPPALIITDSQVFSGVFAKKPKESRLTSFSVLFARFKGDIDVFLEGAKAIDRLTENDAVLIAEACSHNPQDGDIGRVKLPKLLRAKVGENLQVDVVSGMDFKNDLSKYSLIIHCGACMFNRKVVLSRIEAANASHVPITNYGIAIAKLTDILPHVDFA